MTTTDSQLKTVVRNWISNRIVSTNDVYLANNDFVKFQQIKEADATYGVYSTILKDTDTSGQIEFVDTLDANESDSDGRIKVVGKNMFDDAVDSLETSINTINTNLMNYLKFASTEAATATSGVYHTVITNDNSTGQVEIIDTLYNHERDPVAIAIYEQNGEQLDANDYGLVGVALYSADSKCYTYSDEVKDFIDYYVHATVYDDAYHSVMNKHPEWEETLADGVTSYQLIYPPDNSTADGNMVVCGKNMFDGLATRITRLERRLSELISAFENN